MIRASPTWLCAAVAFAACFLPACGKDDDFKIVASFHPGGFTDSRFPWETTITSDGTAVREIHEGQRVLSRKTRILDVADIQGLKAAVTKADFFTIRPQIIAPITDASALSVTVTTQGRTYSVTVSGLGEVKNEPEVQRFLLVWSAILKVVTSPNVD
jgi:hypothetical protein